MSPRCFRPRAFFAVWLIASLACSGVSPARPPVNLPLTLDAAVQQTLTAAPPATPFLLTATPTLTAPPATLAPHQYRTEAGDTVPALALRFRTTAAALLAANVLPMTRTLAPGTVMQVPTSGWAPTAYATRLLPDSAVIYTPQAAEVDLQSFIAGQPGFLASYTETLEANSAPLASWHILQRYAQRYSIHPQLLVALLEYEGHALTNPNPADFTRQYPLGAYSPAMEIGLSHQLGWAANQLNYGYYGWRSGQVLTITLANGEAFALAPSLNAGTVAVLWVLGQLHSRANFAPEAFVATYQQWLGDPWLNDPHVLPAELTQPELQLPFEPGFRWAFTSGPHPGYGSTLPFAALDFAPTNYAGGCAATADYWVTAVHAGRITFSDDARVELDLGNGWVIVYLHVATADRIATGTIVQAGERLGHPSCEGGRATGTHLHLSRKYHGEWIPADGFAPLVLSGWVTHFGARPYQGTLTHAERVITACACANAATAIQLEP